MKTIHIGKQQWQFKDYLNSESFQRYVKDYNIKRVEFEIKKDRIILVEAKPSQLQDKINNIIKLDSFSQPIESA